MLRSFAIAALFVSAAACNKDVTADIEKYADQACACKDAACADKVIADFVAWGQKNKSAGGDEERVAKAATKMAECAMKAGADLQKMMDGMKTLQ